MTILYFCLCIYLDEEDKNNYDYNNLDDMASDSDSDEDEDEDENDDDVGGGENTDILSNSLNNSNNNGINGTRLKNGGINGYNDSKNINKKSAKLYSDLKTYEEESNNNSTIPYNDETYDLLRDEIDKSDLLSTIVKSIDRWRWLSCENDEKENSSVNGGNSANITNGGAGNGISGNGSANGGTSSSNNQSQDNFIAVKISKVFQIRNIIKLFSKLILFQFGGEHKLNSVKSFLNYIHEDTNNKGDNNSNDDDDDDDDNSKKEYTISPSQYHNFRNELMVRYPVYSPPQYELPDIIDICLSDPNILNGNNSIRI
ncbi:unnamed protein product [[Candida] boidinii]|nr:unnamed protein product [[Candida] boidinii]